MKKRTSFSYYKEVQNAAREKFGDVDVVASMFGDEYEIRKGVEILFKGPVVEALKFVGL